MPLRISIVAFTALAALLFPLSVQAYATPEEVLFEESFFLPPSGREARERSEAQRRESAERREREQAEFFESQIEPQESTIEDVLSDLARAIEGLERESPETRRTDRLIARVERRTQESGQTIRSGAPLAPTGAGTAIATLSIMAAVGWTMRKAGKAIYTSS